MIEALTLSQARYKALLAHMPDSAIILFDHDLRRAARGGRAPAGPRLRPRRHGGPAPARACSRSPPLERLEPEYRAALAGEARSFDLELADGVAYWVQIVPLRDESGHIFGGMALSRDISERRRAERALEERARDLERSNAELEQFAYVASHDLSEPLRMVSSYLQLLRRRYHGQPRRRRGRLHRLRRGRRRRACGGSSTTCSPTRAPGAGTRRWSPWPRRTWRSGSATTCRAATAPAPPSIVLDRLPAVMGDAQQLGQLFQNLIGNACKFVPAERTPRVTVSAERDGAHWRFTVADNGIGLDAAHAERIFRMFQRLHSRDEYPGTGIGLAIAKKVVERHGGTIWAEPAPRRRRALLLHPAGGAVKPPRHPARRGQRRRRPADPRGAARGARRGRADRRPGRRGGPRAAPRGRARDDARPDLILLDLNLPRKNGIEVLEEIKADADLRRTPVIMLTTSGSAGDVTACYDRGVNGYVVKPLDLDEFTRIVQGITSFWFDVARLPPR